MSEPIPVRVTRYRCPHCSRSHSGKARCRTHMARCWWNPDAKGCKTCKHFSAYLPSDCDGIILYRSDIAERCDVGVDLGGRPQCVRCNGWGFVLADPGADVGTTKCPDCDGEPGEIKPGPIVGCEKWESAPTLEGAAE